MAEVTNYIDRLVAELCPDGVEYRPIEELFTTRNGYTPSKSNSSYWENGTVPWFRMEDIRENGGVLSEAMQSVHESALKKGGMFPAGSTIVATSATIGEHALINVDFLCNQRFTVLILKDEFKNLLSPKFIYYYSFILDRWCLSNTTQSSFASVDMKRFKKFEFPVPPLEIQEAIVEILDKFTNLEAELEAELEARTLQYQYYRDSLFEALDCPRVPLDSFTQYSKDRKKDDSTVSVYVGVENLKSDFQGCAPTESTNPGVVFQKGDILLGNIRPYLKKMWRADSDGVASPDVLVIRIRDEFSEKISSRYLYHLLASNEFVGYNVAHSRGGKMPRGNKAKILEFEAAIPSLEEQQRIVDILDRFDALTSSLSEGLPAELAARRSQYEYYRDQLLTFPRKGENQ